jgi:hypothetical protein
MSALWWLSGFSMGVVVAGLIVSYRYETRTGPTLQVFKSEEEAREFTKQRYDANCTKFKKED